MQKWFARLALLLFALACFFVPLEGALRLFPQAIPLSLLNEFDPAIRSKIAARRKLQRVEDTVLIPRDDGGPADRMWIYKGGVAVTHEFDEPGIVPTVRMDDMGFCNADAGAYDVEKIDVAALGDSLTWCTNVMPEDAWPARLAELSGLRTYNFGLPGRGLYEYVQILTRFAVARSPRFVVMAVYEGNDLRDAVRYHEAKEGPRHPAAGQRCPFGRDLPCRAYKRLKGGFLARHSYVYNLLLSSAWRIAYSRQKRAIEFGYVVDFPGGASLPFNTENADRDEVGYARELERATLGPGLFDDALDRFVDLSVGHGFVPIVAYIPSAYTAYGPMVRFDDPTISATMHAYSFTQRRYFAGQARRLGYRFLDLTPALQEAARQKGSASILYFRTNVHLTQAGHEIVAREIAALIGPD